MRMLLVYCALAVALVTATMHAQENVIETQTAKIMSQFTGQGFACRVEKTGKAADKLDIKMAMDKNVLYYFALVTGHGEAAVHASTVTLVNQDKKVIPLSPVNLEYGSAIQLHPLTNGSKTLKLVLQRKSDYSLTVCTNKASLYHTEQKNSPLDDHAHF